MAIERYAKGAKRLQVLVFAFPIISGVFQHQSGMPFPPIGDRVTAARFFVCALAVIASLLPYFILPKSHSRAVIVGLALTFALSVPLYLHLENVFVVPIPQADGSLIFVTRGSARVSDLGEPYRSMSDEQLIQHSGLTNADLEEVYTKESLDANRNKLLWTYVASLVLFELTLGSMAKAGEKAVTP